MKFSVKKNSQLKEILYILMYITTLLIPNYFKLAFGNNYLKNIIGLLFSYILLLAPFLLKIRTKVYLILTIPLLILSILETGYYLLSRDLIPMGVWASIFNTNIAESRSFILGQPLLIGILFFYLCVFIFVYFSTQNNQEYFNNFKIRVVIFLGMLLFVCSFLFGSYAKNTYPYVFLYKIYELKQLEKKEKEVWLNSKICNIHVERDPAFKYEEKEVYVLVIGESMRRKNLGIYGYKRNTTPNLLKISKEICFFDNVISSSSLTMFAIPTLLCNHSFNKDADTSCITTIMNVMKEMKFKTYWIENQSRFLASDVKLTFLANQAENMIYPKVDPDPFLVAIDGKALPKLDNILKEKYPKKFIVIHLLGNHYHAKATYPPEYNIFFKNGASPKEEYINFYDNSILYSDFIISQIIKKVKSENAKSLIVYLSDHGETIFDDDSKEIGHWVTPLNKTDFQIPLFVWLSPKFREQHNEVIVNMSKNKHKPIISSGLFHSLSGILGVKCEYYNCSEDFFGNNYKAPDTLHVMDFNCRLVKYEDLKGPL